MTIELHERFIRLCDEEAEGMTAGTLPEPGMGAECVVVFSNGYEERIPHSHLVRADEDHVLRPLASAVAERAGLHEPWRAK